MIKENRSSPRWIPAEVNGSFVVFKHTQMLSFNVGDEENMSKLY